MVTLCFESLFIEDLCGVLIDLPVFMAFLLCFNSYMMVQTFQDLVFLVVPAILQGLQRIYVVSVYM